jgi:glycosyltransferase involved in cell wall biosynthesis
MFKDLRVAVVIPAYREASRIKGVISTIPPWVDHVIVVDDASPDATHEAASAVQDRRLVVLRHEVNQGVGGATITGFRKALELGADLLVKMDGDGQMDPAGLPSLLEPIQRGEADYTKGNRFLHTQQLTRMPWLRRFGNVGLSFMAKLASGYWQVFDPANGYLAIHSAVVPLLDTRRLARRFFFESSMLLELGLIRAVVRDVHMPARYGNKQSHLSEWRVLLEFPPLLLRGLLRRLLLRYFVFDFAAPSLFLAAGVAASFFGFGWGFYHWLRSAATGFPASTGTVMVAVLPLMFGVQLLLQAFVMDVQDVPREPIHRAHGCSRSRP